MRANSVKGGQDDSIFAQNLYASSSLPVMSSPDLNVNSPDFVMKDEQEHKPSSDSFVSAKSKFSET